MTKRKSFIPEGYEKEYLEWIKDVSKYKPDIPPKVSKTRPTLELYGVTEKILEANKKKHELYDKIARYAFIGISLVVLFLFISLIVIYVIRDYTGLLPFIGRLLGGIFFLFCSFIFINIYTFGIADKVKTDVDKRVERYNQHLEAWKYWYELYPQKKAVSYWQKLSGYKFEHELASIFIKNGFDTEITKKSGDGGVDIILNPKGQKIYIQCKAYESHTGVAVVRELLGTMELNDVEYGVIACTGGFTKGAIEMAVKVGIHLLDANSIVSLMDKDIPLDYFYRKR